MTRFLPALSNNTFLFFLLLVFLSSCKNGNDEEKVPVEASEEVENVEPFFDVSLAQWSLSKPILSGEMDPMDFAQKANEMGFKGLEYVSQLYTPLYKDSADPKAALQTVLDTLKTRSERYDVENILIMVDGEGDLASNSEAERNQAVENHKKWVDAADYLGAHSIRVNLFVSNVPE